MALAIFRRSGGPPRGADHAGALCLHLGGQALRRNDARSRGRVMSAEDAVADMTAKIRSSDPTLLFALWHPDDFAKLGYALPPHRPEGLVLVRVTAAGVDWVPVP